MTRLGRFGPLHTDPFRGASGSRRGAGHQAGAGRGEHVLCFPAATPSPCRTRTHVTGSPKTKVQRIPQSGQPGTGHSQKRQGQGSAQSYAVGHTWTAMRRARRARSPFPWAPWTPLLAGTVHCQQLPKESLSLRDRDHEGGKRV